MTMQLKIPNWRIKAWRQVDGDMNPGTYGATIARADGSTIELLQIQPTREYVGDREAVEVGFPFWSKEATYDLSDLTDYDSALQSSGLTESELETMKPDDRALAISIALFDHGDRVEEGPAGWAKDVLGDRRVRWWGLGEGGKPKGWRYLEEEDREFRALLRRSLSPKAYEEMRSEYWRKRLREGVTG